MAKPTQKALIEAVRNNPDLLERLLLVADQHNDYRPAVTVPEKAYRAVAPLIEGFRDERLAVVALDRKRRQIAAEVLTVGNGGFTIVCPRQILRGRLAEHG